MRRSVYVETTIFGYLAMRWSKVLKVAANQATTHEWWNDHRNNFDLFVSPFVTSECLRGDPLAAKERLAFLQGIPNLDITPEVESLAKAIAKTLQIPEKAGYDAYHIAIGAVHGIQYLLTWNCKHIANPEFLPKIEKKCRELGLEPPLICTPMSLLEINDV